MGEDLWRDDRIFEKRTGAAAIGFALDDEHAFGVTNRTDSVVDLDWRGLGLGEMTSKIGISQAGFARPVEAKGNAGDDVAPRMGGIEDAAAIGESALRVVEGHEAGALKVEHTHLGDRLGDLLTVGTDVLDRSTTDRPGDSGETFDAADSLLADREDEGVPVCTGRDGVLDEVLLAGDCKRTVERDVEDESVKA